MKKKINRKLRKFIRMIKRTWKQKLAGILLILVGYVSMIWNDYDATVFIFSLMVSIPLILTTKKLTD